MIVTIFANPATPVLKHCYTCYNHEYSGRPNLRINSPRRLHIILNKILITIQGKTLILYYRINRGLTRKNTALPVYIEVLPSDELSRFNLRGLSPEMFCVNIADMVNMRGLFAGVVENERQEPVARWTMSEEEYRELTSLPVAKLTHPQLVSLLSSFNEYVQETDHQYIDFEADIISHSKGEQIVYSGYRLTLVTENFEGEISSYAYFNLDTRTAEGWQGILPPQTDHKAILSALDKQLQAIRKIGVQLAKVHDETDYAL